MVFALIMPDMVGHFYKICLGLLLVSVLFGCMGSEGGSDPLASGGAPGSVDDVPKRWADFRLNTGLPLRVASYFTNDMPPSMNDGTTHIIDDLQGEWNAAVPEDTFFERGLASIPNKDADYLISYENDGEMGIYRSTSWFSYLDNVHGRGILAVTQYTGVHRNVGSSSHHIEITHADIIVNYRDFTYVWDNSANGNAGEYDLPSIIFHELGHFLGMEHASSGTRAVMAPTLDDEDQYRTLYQWDKDEVRDLYRNAWQSSLTVNSAITTRSSDGPVEGERSRGILELRADGSCRHYVEGELVSSHRAVGI